MQHEHEHSHGGSKPTYNMVFLVLAALTLIEVFVAEIGLPDMLGITILMGLALIKAGLVVAFYMHLKYDPPIFTWILLVPVIMGIGVILSLRWLAGY